MKRVMPLPAAQERVETTSRLLNRARVRLRDAEYTAARAEYAWEQSGSRRDERALNAALDEEDAARAEYERWSHEFRAAARACSQNPTWGADGHTASAEARDGS